LKKLFNTATSFENNSLKKLDNKFFQSWFLAMASCGAINCDEKKEDQPVLDCSLKNVVAFSTVKSQMDVPTISEGCITTDDEGKTVDRRNKVLFGRHKFNCLSYRTLFQLTAKTPRGSKGVGSGVMCDLLPDIRPTFITCAHNVSYWSQMSNKVIKFKEIYCFVTRIGEKSWFRCNYVDNDENVIVHPKYNGRPDCGFDICILPRTREISGKVNFKVKYPFLTIDCHMRLDKYFKLFKMKVKEGMAIEVPGYPGEKDGYAYTHEGTIKKITKTDLGGYLLWYDADTSGGNSGSPIFCTDQEFVKSTFPDSPISKLLIGVHNGHDVNEGLNFGTLITQKLWNGLLKLHRNQLRKLHRNQIRNDHCLIM